MPMSDGTNQLKKIAFQIGDTFFRFAINPENYTHRKPHRTTAVKTKSRIVIEDFQSDIPVISIRGTTGFNPTGASNDRGIEKIKEMKSFIEAYAERGGNGDTPVDEFYFHNFTNDEYYVVHLSPEGVNFTQDVNSPLTYRYEITFTVLRKAGEPNEDDIIAPEIGNKFPSIPTGPGFNGSPYAPGHVNEEGQNIYEWLGERQYEDSGSDDVYRNSPEEETPTRHNINLDPVNPQVPSDMSYQAGVTGLGYSIGYYGRALS
jgi:hypothetical protein